MYLIASALAGPPALYNDDDLRIAGDRVPRAELVKIAKGLERNGVHFALGGIDTAASELPYGALGLIWIATEQAQALEYDLWVPGASDAPEPFSLSIVGDRWSLTTATPAPRTAPELNRALGDAGLVPAGAVPWEAEVAGAIAEALVLLSPAERAAIAGVHLQRVRDRPVKADGPTVATYLGDGANARIEVYDPATDATVRFVGHPKHPYHPTSLVVLHEVAHAIADRPIRLLVAEHDRERLAVLASQAQLAQDTVAHNARVKQHNQTLDPAEALRLQAAGALLQERSAALKRDVGRLNQGARLLAEPRVATPIGAAYWSEVGRAPTRYGETSPDEAFAEAFALYKLDPEALEHLIPGAVAWFQRGMHTAPP